MNKMQLNKLEKQTTNSISLVMSLRMFGIFIIMPVLSIYAFTLSGANSFLVGFAFGAYSLAQAIMQIPFGTWSDRANRVNVIEVGLLLFVIGSLMCFFSTSIYTFIFARCVQGLGAIGGTMMALLSDNIREDYRTQSMSVVGISIGIAFLLSIIAAPLTASLLGIKQIFVLMSIFACIAITILELNFKRTDRNELNQATKKIPNNAAINLKKNGHGMIKVLMHKNTFRYQIGIFLSHLLFAINFMVIPYWMAHTKQYSNNKLAFIYGISLLASILILRPMLSASKKQKKINKLFQSSIFLGLLSQIILLLTENYIGIVVSLSLFFAFFIFIESLMPSEISRIVEKENRGLALGINSFFQFLGIFAGGIIAGIVGISNLKIIYIITIIIIAVWLIFGISKNKTNT